MSFGLRVCGDCPSGKYTDQTKRTSCKECPQGWKSNIASKATGCTACGAGFYVNPQQNYCTNCPKGKYNGQTKQISCTDCPEGRYAQFPKYTSCTYCPVGKYNGQTGGDHVSKCKNCPVGKYNDQLGQDNENDCKNCPEGRYNPHTGQDNENDCTKCPMGTYNPNTGGSDVVNDCKNCPVGEYNIDTGQNSCTKCPVGEYNDQLGQLTCKNCPKGTYNDQLGEDNENDCNNCPAGKFNNLVARSSCFNCPQGRFATTAGARSAQDNCDQCETGKYGHLVDSLIVPISSAIACKNCVLGKYQSEKGMTNCAQCAQHLYQDQEGQISCKGCPSGKFGNLTDTLPVSSDVVCKDCPQGYWQPTAISANCNLCSPGRYSTSSGLSGECPQWCDPGQEQTLLATSCQDCDVAKFRTNKEDPMNCIQCVAGKYQDQKGEPLCKNCMMGKYLPLLSIDDHDSPEDCKMCLVGFHAGITGQYECDICASPSYQDEVGQSQCKICVAGQFRTTRTGCTDCVVGKYQNEIGKVFCNECPTGYKSDVSGLAQCLQCGNGQYTDAKGQPTCKKCPWRGTCQHLTTIHPKTRIGVAGPWYDRNPFVGTRLTLKNMIENGKTAVQTNKRLYDRKDFITIGDNDPYKNVQSECPDDATTRNIGETECRDIHWSTGSPVISDVETKRKHVSSRNIFFETTECPLENKIYDEETCRLGGGTPGYAITDMNFYNPYNRLFYKCEQFADDQITEPGPYKNEPGGVHFAQSLVDECNRGRTVTRSVCNIGSSWSKIACNWGKKLAGGTLSTGETRSSVMHACYNGIFEVCRKKQFYKSAKYYRSEHICDSALTASECAAAAVELGLSELSPPTYTEVTSGKDTPDVPNGCIMHEDGHVTYNVDTSTSERTQKDFCTYKTGKECICKSDMLDTNQCAAATELELSDLTQIEDYVTYYRSGEICSPSDSFDNDQECKVAAEWLKTNRPDFTGLTDIDPQFLKTDTIVFSPLENTNTCFLDGNNFYWKNNHLNCGDGGCVCKRNELPKGCSTYNSKAYWSDNSNENPNVKYHKVDIIPNTNFIIDSGSTQKTCVDKNNKLKFGIEGDGFTKQCLDK